MTTTLLYLLTLLSTAHLVTAATYAQPGDKWDTGHLACQHMSPAQVEHGFAHRSAPCGSVAMICAKRCAVGWVVDRGPYGALTRTGWRLRRRLRAGERYRGEVDLRVGLARAVGVRGVRGVVVIWAR
jgi:hypothetical protein